MFTLEDIEQIRANPEKETLTVELKSFRKLFSADSSDIKDIAYEIVALANRHGGKLILGLNNDGSFDGKLPLKIDAKKEITVDSVKEKMHNICNDSISPRIDCETQFLQCAEGDVIIVNIPKKKNIPHAYVPNKTATEINNRIYYIRTSHGKKLVSDRQLEWLFKHDYDPNFTKQYRIAIDFNKQFGVIGDKITLGNYYISGFIHQLRFDELDELFQDSKKLGAFFTQLIPYFILKSYTQWYVHSWYIGVNNAFDRKSSGPMIAPHKTTPLKIDSIKVVGDTILNSFSWNFNDAVKNAIHHDLQIPPDTNVSIVYQADKTLSEIRFDNPDFEFVISCGLLSYGAGLHQHNPSFQILSEIYGADGHTHSMQNFYHVDCAVWFDAKFKFPEYDMGEFEKYFHYANTIDNLLNDEWNFDRLREKFPPKEIMVMNHKIDEILGIIRPNNNNGR
jgi:hypothetical protein